MTRIRVVKRIVMVLIDGIIYVFHGIRIFIFSDRLSVFLLDKGFHLCEYKATKLLVLDFEYKDIYYLGFCWIGGSVFNMILKQLALVIGFLGCA